MGSCLTSLLLDVDFDISIWSLLHVSKRQTQEPQRECERGVAKFKYATGIIRSKQLGQVSRKLNPNTARHFGQAPSWLAFCICLQSINTKGIGIASFIVSSRDPSPIAGSRRASTQGGGDGQTELCGLIALGLACQSSRSRANTHNIHPLLLVHRFVSSICPLRPSLPLSLFPPRISGPQLVRRWLFRSLPPSIAHPTNQQRLSRACTPTFDSGPNLPGITSHSLHMRRVANALETA